VRADEQIAFLLDHQAHGRLGRFRRRAAGIGEVELDLAAHDAAGLVDLLDRELARRLLRGTEQRGGAARGIEQTDLERISGARVAQDDRRRHEGGAAGDETTAGNGFLLHR
jgi:hypothetical protein